MSKPTSTEIVFVVEEDPEKCLFGDRSMTGSSVAIGLVLSFSSSG